MVTSAADGAAISGPSPQDLPDAGIKGTAWIGLQSSVVNFASLAVFIVLGRLLDPRAFGLVASASVVILFLRILVDGGISKALIQREHLTDDVVDSAFWAAVVFGVVLTVIVIAAAPLVARLFHEPSLTNVVRALSSVLILASLDRTQSALLDRRMAFRKQAARGTAAALLSAGAAIGAAVAGWGVWALVVQSITFELVTVVFLWSLSGWHPRFRFSRTHLSELLPFGGRYVGIVVTQYLNLNVDNLLIGVFLGPIALGIYVVAYRILIVSNEALVVTITRVGLATFSRLQRDEAELKRAFYTVARLSAAVALPLFAGLAVLAPQAISIVFGSKWDRAAAVLQVLCIAGIAQAITSFTHPLVVALGKLRNELRWNLAACGLQMIGFGAAVHFGIVAVAWSLAGATTILVPARIVFMRHMAGISIRSYFVQLTGPTVSMAIMILAVLCVDRGLTSQGIIVRFISEIAAGAVCYVASLTLLDRKTARLLAYVLRSLHP
jgi:O-antigen/teichoic acid export membrane protein